MSTEFRIKLIEESEGFPTPPPVPPPDRGSFDFAPPAPTRPAGPSAMPDWYPEYRTLRNAKDAGQTLSAGLEKRLGQLEEALQKEAATPVAPEPAAPAPESPPPAPAPAPPEPELRPNPDLDALIGLGNQAAAAAGTPSAFDFSPAKPEAAPPLFNEGGIFTGFSPPTPEEPTLPPGVKPFDFSPEPLFRALPVLDDIDKRIVEVLDKFRAGLLSADEAAQRLEGTVSGGKATDKFRAAYGPDADPKAIVAELLKTVAEKEKLPGVSPAASPGLFDQLGPLLNMVPGGSQLSRMGRAIGLEDMLGGKSFDPSKGIGDVFGKLKGLVSGEGAAGAGVGAGAAAGGEAAAGLAEGAAAAGASLAGLASVAAPLAAAYLAADYAAGKMADRLGQAERGIRRMGDMAVAVAGNDGLGLVQTASEGVAQALEQVPVAGQVWAAEIRLMTGTAETANKVFRSFIDRGKELQGYNAQLAVANANARVREILADQREAAQIGESVGRLTDNMSQVSTDLRDTFLPIKELGTEVLAGGSDIIRELSEFLKVVRPIIKVQADAAKFWLKMENAGAVQLIELAVKVFGSTALLEWLNITKENKPTNEQLNSILSGLLTAPIPMMQPPRQDFAGDHARQAMAGPFLRQA